MYISTDTKRSWVEIDLGQIIENYRIYRSTLPEGSQIMAVVKADAYGHGDVEVSRALYEAGVRLFAVSNIDEAKTLRGEGIGGEILILGYTPKENLSELQSYDITQTLLCEEYAELIINSGLNIKCQLAIDTGMNRIGIDGDNADYCEKLIREYSKKLKLNGFFTHLCVADSKKREHLEFTRAQIEKFNKIREKTSDLSLDYIHYMNSAAGLFHNRGGIVRLGICMYGLKPDYDNILPDSIKPALSWKTAVSMVKKISKGEHVGYGNTYVAQRDTYIATLPTGYADGYRRELSNNGHVLIDGQMAPIVGKVCMDQTMIDVTNLVEGGKNIRIGDEVILIGQSGNEIITADDIASSINTIGYEIICGISKRVPRLYSR